MGFWRKTSIHGRKNWRLHQNWTLSARGVSHEEVFFKKMTWSWSISTSGGRPPLRVSKVIYTCLWRSFEEKRSFRRNYICIISLDCNCKKWCFVVSLLITSGQWTKNLQFSEKKDSAASSKLHFTFGRQKLDGKNCFFLKKLQCFLLFVSFGQKNSGYGWKIYGSFVGFAFYVSSQHVEDIGEIEHFLTIIGLWAKRSRTSSRKFPAGLSELHYTCPEDNFQKRFTLWMKNFPKVFLDQGCKLFAILKIFFRHGC